MCEPLREKIRYAPNIIGREITTRKEAWVVFDFAVVKSAVEFYKKYGDNPYEFKKNYPDEYLKFEPVMTKPMWKQYNKWLFNYCFCDVIDDEG